MNKQPSALSLISKRYTPFLFFSFFAFLVYLPAFLVEFGFHNDYSMLLPDQRGWLDFIEARHLVMISRAMGAVMTSIHCWMLTYVSDFTVSRFVSFLSLFLSFGLFAYFFQRRCRLSPFWAAVIVFGLVMLPSNQVNVLWSANFVPGSLNILLSIISYLLIDYARGENVFIAKNKNKLLTISCLLGAFFIFVFSLFVYPPTSLFIFVFTSSLIFFSPLRKWRDTRRIVLKDMIFFGIGLLVYRALDRMVIIPWAVQSGNFPKLADGLFSSEITTNFLSKVPLIKETFLFSLSGIWQLVIGTHGGWILIGVIIVCLLLTFPLQKTALMKSLSARERSGISWAPLFQAIFTFVILFFFVNAPTFLARGCFTVVGFRVLLPSSAMFLILQIAIMRKLDQSLNGKCALSAIKLITAALALGWGITAFWNVLTATLNYKYELNFIRSKVIEENRPRINRFIVSSLPSGESLIGRRLPLEFGMMIASQTHVKPLIDELLKEQNAPPKEVSLVGASDVLFFDSHSALIDLNNIRTPPRTGRQVRLWTSSKNVFVHAEGHLTKSDEGAFLVFEQNMAGQRLPFWQISSRSNQRDHWFEIDFEDTPARLRGYKIINAEADNKDWKDTRLGWILQGSMDGKKWMTLDRRGSRAEEYNVWEKLHVIKRHGLYKRYKFHFRTAVPIRIFAIGIILEE